MAGDGPEDGKTAGRQDDGAQDNNAQGRAARVRGRNLVLGGALIVLVLLLYAISFVKTPAGPGGPVAEQPATGEAPAARPAAQPLSGLRKD
ncbi:MAG: hypothetical protein RIB84_21540 [Sneathiellaceae bacterium]